MPFLNRYKPATTRRAVIRRLAVLLLGLTIMAASAIAAAAESLPPMTVYKSPTCGCCVGWIEHLEAEGFDVTARNHDDMGAIKARFEVPRELTSCHTAVIGDYVIEGHVPAADIRRLLAEQPEADGLAVPGMPIGSPGMEIGDRHEPYRSFLFTENDIREFARHGEPAP